MEWFVTGLLAVAALLFLATRKRRSAVCLEEVAPYVLVEHLFSPAERLFFRVLEQSLGDEFRVFGKVRVADVLGIATCQTRAAWQKAFNQISGKHFDFLLCRPGDLQPVCAIELNDIAHARGKRKRRDEFLHHACAAAGLPLVFFPAQRTYLPDDVRGVVAVALGAPVMQEPGSEVVFPELAAACRGSASH